VGVVAKALRRWAAPVALAAGIAVQVGYPGDFGSVFHGNSPAWPAWVAAFGGGVALLVGLASARRMPYERSAGLAVALFLLPVFVHGFRHWSPSSARPPSPLTAGLVHALRYEVPKGATVYSDPETSYRIAAEAPVYVCVAPPGHVANTTQNHPYARVDEFRRFVASGGEIGPVLSCGPRWFVIDRSRYHLVPSSPFKEQPSLVYHDERYWLYGPPSSAGSSSASS
jgi:hypothetical protein